MSITYETICTPNRHNWYKCSMRSFNRSILHKSFSKRCLVCFLLCDSESEYPSSHFLLW